MMRYEISTEPGDVRPGDLVVFRLQTKNSVKWSCGPVRCFTDDRTRRPSCLPPARYPSTRAMS